MNMMNVIILPCVLHAECCKSYMLSVIMPNVFMMSVVDPNWVWLITGLYQTLLKSLGRVDFIIQSLTNYDAKMFYNTCHNPFMH